MEDDIISEGGEEYETTDSVVKKRTWKQKRQRHRSSDVKRGKAKRCRSIVSAPKIDRKKLTYTGRWTTIRYEQGEESILKILKANGAVFGNPISRHELRTTARKHIGDTGLLDHLLKHMDGKVAPGGTERFRRRHSFTGQMEYWLESADLMKIREDAGVEDPFWVPPPGWKPGSTACQDPIAATELKLLKEEMVRMKRDIKELISTKQDKDNSSASPNSHLIYQRANFDSSLLLRDTLKELMKWKSKITKQLLDISSSLSCMQDVYADLETWKVKIEQKKTDITNSVSSLQEPKHYNTFSPSAPESWQDIFGSTDLITQQGTYTPWFDDGDLIDLTQGNLAPWLDCSELVKVEPDTSVQDPYLIPTSESLYGDVNFQQSCSGLDVNFQQSCSSLNVNFQQSCSGLDVNFQQSCSGLDVNFQQSCSGLDVNFQQSCSGLVKIEPDTSMQDLLLIPDPELKSSVQQSACSDELELLREEMSRMKKDIQVVMSKKQDKDDANLTPDSSVTTDSNLDLESSLQMLQDMHAEVVNWKAKIDQQLSEISSSFGSMEAVSRKVPERESCF